MFVIDNVRVSFHHDIEQEDGEPVRGSTICLLEKKHNDEFEKIGWGEAICYPKDQFNKAIGRKVALTKALNGFFSDKEFRTRVWNKYFNMTKFPR